MRKLMAAMMMTMAAVVAVQTTTAAQMKPAPAAQAKTTPSAVGVWNMTIDTPHGAMVMKVDLKLDGRKLTGTLGNDMIGEHALTGEMTDGAIRFKFTAEGGGDMEFNGKLKDADSLVGTLTSAAGDMACTGARVKGK